MEGKLSCENGIYTEGAGYANHFRIQQQQELYRYIECMREKANGIREQYLKPDYSSLEKYTKSIQRYRDDFMQMLGFPEYMFEGGSITPEAAILPIAEDRYGEIFRLVISISDGLSAYGLLFLPKSGGPYPLVIIQHGGGGTPEKCAEINGPSAYNNMVRRVLERGCAVFAPQTMTWA